MDTSLPPSVRQSLQQQVAAQERIEAKIQRVEDLLMQSGEAQIDLAYVTHLLEQDIKQNLRLISRGLSLLVRRYVIEENTSPKRF